MFTSIVLYSAIQGSLCNGFFRFFYRLAARGAALLFTGPVDQGV